MMEWQSEGRHDRMPSAPRGRASAGRSGPDSVSNWTTKKQAVAIEDTRLPETKAGDAVVLHTSDHALGVAALHGEKGHRRAGVGASVVRPD